MFGYLGIDKKSADNGEKGLFGTFMCALCLSTKNLFGNLKRLSVSNDINLFNILFHSYSDIEVKVVSGKCVLSPFKDRPLILPDNITDKLACFNMILVCFNLADDVSDEKNVYKKIVLSSFKRSLNIAKERERGFYESVKNNYEKLQMLEKTGCVILDELCHPFSLISQSVSEYVLAEKNDVLMSELCYHLGKWVYLIDALDDLEKDIRRKAFNPLLSAFGGKTEDPKVFVRENKEVLEPVFYATLYKIAQCFNDMRLNKYICVLKNVFYKSIRNKTEEVFAKYAVEGQ